LFVSLLVTRVFPPVTTQKGVCFPGPLCSGRLARNNLISPPPPRRNQSPLVSSLASPPPRGRQPRRGEWWTGPPLSQTKTLSGSITHRAARAPAGSLPHARTHVHDAERGGGGCKPSRRAPPSKETGQGGQGGRAPQRGAKGGGDTHQGSARSSVGRRRRRLCTAPPPARAAAVGCAACGRAAARGGDGCRCRGPPQRRRFLHAA